MVFYLIRYAYFTFLRVIESTKTFVSQMSQMSKIQSRNEPNPGSQIQIQPYTYDHVGYLIFYSFGCFRCFSDHFTRYLKYTDCARYGGCTTIIILQLSVSENGLNCVIFYSQRVLRVLVIIYFNT